MRYGYLIAACLAARLALAPASAQEAASSRPAATVDSAFAGHYYLSGIMETGSELLLRKDGSFEWYMSYGALDQFAQGTWRRQGDRIVLAAKQPAQDRPLFAYLDTQPWSAEAEQSRLASEHDAKEEAVRANCPFLMDNVSTTAPVPILDPEGEARKPSAEELRGKSEAALVTAQEARARMEKAARRIMAGPGIDAAAASEARQVTSDWYEASNAARDAAHAAGLPEADLPDPVLPPACDIPERQTVDADKPESWKGGLAVRVIDPKSGNDAKGVKVSLLSPDGKIAAVTTSGSGVALLPDMAGADPAVASLSAPYAPGPDVLVKFPPVKSGIIRFSMDIEQLLAPPFKTLTLRIDGTTLLPEEFGRGRYSR